MLSLSQMLHLVIHHLVYHLTSFYLIFAITGKPYKLPIMNYWKQHNNDCTLVFVSHHHSYSILLGNVGSYYIFSDVERNWLLQIMQLFDIILLMELTLMILNQLHTSLSQWYYHSCFFIDSTNISQNAHWEDFSWNQFWKLLQDI